MATPVIVKMRLKTLKRWAEREADVDKTALYVQNFTADECCNLQREIARTKESGSDGGTISGSMKEKLTPFNGKAETWDRSKRLLIAYLNQIKGCNGDPLYYVIRDLDMETTYQTENGAIGDMIYNAEHRGRSHQQDSFKVMQVLRQWTSGGMANTYTDKTENVQDAWDKMLRVFEGVGAKGATIQRAREMIRTAHWTRDTQNVKFSDYFTKHITANNYLNKYKANANGGSQVQAFLRGIKADAAVNPHLLGIKTTILTNEDTKDDVYKAVITFKDTVRNLGGMTGVTDTRRVLSIQSGRGHGGRGGYGRVYGRGGGRSRGGGRGGRHGNGRGRGYGGGRI
mgnify:CR=1 FL=1